MPDLYLQALMQGEVLKKSLATSISSKEKKNRFELATEKVIEDHIKTLTFDEDNLARNRFVTPEMERSRVQAEFKEKAKLTECENYDLATRLFSAATDIDPVLIGPRVFLIDCYLKREMNSEAKDAYAEAMNISEVSQIDDSWKEMLSIYDELLKKI